MGTQDAFLSVARLQPPNRQCESTFVERPADDQPGRPGVHRVEHDVATPTERQAERQPLGYGPEPQQPGKAQRCRQHRRSRERDPEAMADKIPVVAPAANREIGNAGRDDARGDHGKSGSLRRSAWYGEHRDRRAGQAVANGGH